MHLKEMLPKALKIIGVDTRQAIIGALVLVLVGGSAGLLHLSKTALEISLLILNTQMPLWAATFLIVLCCLYTYLKVQKSDPSNLPQKRNYIIKYFTIGNYKWETKIYDTGDFVVDEYPFCPIHDLRFIPDDYDKCCPGPEKGTCNNRLRGPGTFATYESAKSIIENKIKNKTY